MGEQIEVQQIPVKVYRTPDRLTVAAPMPGLGPDDITVNFVLTGSAVWSPLGVDVGMRRPPASWQEPSRRFKMETPPDLPGAPSAQR